ncbi:hypothetical protein VTH82DRAFT_1746 [Thermothelomyces myriococcoides]
MASPTSSTLSPALVLVSGAFGTPAGFNRLAPFLERAGITSHPGPYPSCDLAASVDDPASAPTSRDAAALRDNVLLSLLDGQSRDVIIPGALVRRRAWWPAQRPRAST